MRICKVTLTQNFLSNLDTNERNVLIHAAHTLNELTTLSKLFRLASASPDSEAERQMMFIQSMCLLRLLAGKMYESWLTFNKLYFGTGLSNLFSSRIDQDTTDLLRVLKKFFSGNSAIKTIRHDYAFHYGPGTPDQGMSTIPRDTPLDIFFDKTTENTVYGFAEQIISHSALVSISPEPRESFDTLMDETSEKCDQFQQLLSELVGVILLPASVEWNEGGNLEVTEVDATQWGEARVLRFVEKPQSFKLDFANGTQGLWRGGNDMQSELLKRLYDISRPE